MDLVFLVRCKKRSIECVVDLPHFGEVKLIHDRGEDLDNCEGSFSFQDELWVVLRFTPILFFRTYLFFSRDYSSLPRHRPADSTCLRNRFLPSASSDFSDSLSLTHIYFFAIPSHSTTFLLLCHCSGTFRVSGI